MPNLLIDRSTQSVQYSGNIISLNALEFEILWQLANRPGKVFSPEDLYYSVPKNLTPSKETISKITHYISYKVGHPAFQFIQGQGFVLSH